MFLPDRYIKGECPRCGAKDQYGDSCEVCGAVYAPTELKNPYSTLIRRDAGAEDAASTTSSALLAALRRVPAAWTQRERRACSPRCEQDEGVVARDGDGGLADWDISRDAPYFGIEIPDAPGKYFYVWLDAPIGYLASLKNYCAKTGIDYRRPRRPTRRPTEQVHFIGKDIIYFHTLFWPAMLQFSGRKLPTNVFVHGT